MSHKESLAYRKHLMAKALAALMLFKIYQYKESLAYRKHLMAKALAALMLFKIYQYKESLAYRQALNGESLRCAYTLLRYFALAKLNILKV